MRKGFKSGIDSLRGIGKLGWTERGKLYSLLRSLTYSFSDADKGISAPSKIKKAVVVCPGCGKKFKTNNPSKIPQHKPRFWSFYITDSTPRFCSQKASILEKPTIVENIQSTVINELVIVPGDSIAFMTRPFQMSFQDQHELKEWKVKKIHMMNNGKVHLRLEGLDETVPVHIFTKNFIKL